MKFAISNTGKDIPFKIKITLTLPDEFYQQWTWAGLICSHKNSLHSLRPQI